MKPDKEATGVAPRRASIVATAGLGVAAVIGSLVAAAPASAATTPTDPSVSLTLPDQIANDGTAADVGVTVDNTQAGADKQESLRFQAVLTLPSGITCDPTNTNPSIKPESGTVTIDGTTRTTTSPPLAYDASASTDQKCVYDVPDQYNNGLKKNEKDQFTYSLKVNGQHATKAATTGALKGTFSVIQLNDTGGFESTLASDSDTAQLKNPSAPSFNTAPTSGATLYHKYSYDLVDSAGLPATPAQPQGDGSDASDEGYYAVSSTTDANGDVSYNGRKSTECDVHLTGSTTNLCVIDLGEIDGYNDSAHLYFDASDGALETATVNGDGVYTPTSPDHIVSDPNTSWTIIANNGEGGSDGEQAESNDHPMLNDHDVASGSFKYRVLFGDVALSNGFADDIYGLVENFDPPVIKGYGDGNFKRANPVTRQAFVTFAARLIHAPTGPCVAGGGEEEGTQFTTSGYSDVSDNSPFCQQVAALTTVGVIQGYNDGTFKPAKHISRQAIAAYLFRLDSAIKGAQVGDAKCETPTHFNDVSPANPFCGDIEWVHDHNIANGYDDGGFHPDAATTRQASAAFLSRFVDLEGGVQPTPAGTNPS
jgi:hypothetical protein